MVFKNIDMVAFLNNIAKIQRKKLPVKVSYALALNYKKLNEIATTYNEEVNKLDPEKDKEAVLELLNTEVTVDIQKVKISEFEKIEANSKYDVLTPDDFALIWFMIDD